VPRCGCSTAVGESSPTSADQGGSDESSHGPLGAYSMTLVAEITHGGAGVSSFDFELQNIPEPALLTLFAVGLLGAGVSARRRLASQRT